MGSGGESLLMLSLPTRNQPEQVPPTLRKRLDNQVVADKGFLSCGIFNLALGPIWVFSNPILVALLN